MLLNQIFNLHREFHFYQSKIQKSEDILACQNDNEKIG